MLESLLVYFIVAHNVPGSIGIKILLLLRHQTVCISR